MNKKTVRVSVTSKKKFFGILDTYEIKIKDYNLTDEEFKILYDKLIYFLELGV